MAENTVLDSTNDEVPDAEACSVVSLPGNAGSFAGSLARRLSLPHRSAGIHRFPDGETSVRIDPDGNYTNTLLVHSLADPNETVIPLLFLAETLREFGAERLTLVAPYLAYMRQDKRFRPGDGVSVRYFAGLLSHYFNALVTVDPHLHRVASLGDVYSIPTRVVHAAADVAQWIVGNVERPLIIGPDSESRQWVADVSRMAGVPHIVLEKVRHGDNDVEISVPEMDRRHSHTPVLVDDIVSSGGTMIEAVKTLRTAGFHSPVCVAVHGIFADNAYGRLRDAGARRVVSTNTILHESNAIDLSSTVADKIQSAGVSF